MASTYTYDITNTVGQIRLLIGDTDISPTTDAQFSDEELTFFYSTMANSSLMLAASYALEAWAATITDSLKSEHIGDYSYSKDTAGKKIELAKKYRDEDGLNPAMAWSQWDLSGVTDTTISEDIE